MQFYENFQRLCAQRGEAETMVCRRLGMSSAMPKQWRDGKIPRPSTLKMIADYFDVSVDFFSEPFPEAPIKEDDEPSPIGIRVITQEEADLLAKIQRLNDREKRAVIRLVEELCEQ